MTKTQSKSVAIASQPTLIGVTPAILEAALKSLGAPGGKPIKTGDDFLELFTQAGAQQLFTPPKIGEYWPGQGGVYAGQVREEDGACYHEILATVKPTGLLNHAAATKWAKSVTVDGHKDFELPSIRACSLLFANLRDRFERVGYWAKETYSGNASYAWFCYFNYGDTDYFRKSSERQAVAVRRFVL